MRENVPLAPYTTLGVGGSARYLADCTTEEEVRTALLFAKERALPVAVLGGGANTLVKDEGFDGVVLRIGIMGTTISADGTVVAGAAVLWDDLVREVSERELWGIENLAGIPGTVGGAAVQNIGAYGAELSTVFEYALALDSTLTPLRIARVEAKFGYRDSIFKQRPGMIITSVALALSLTPRPLLSYADLATLAASGEPLSTPTAIGEAVRRIRSGKFPTGEGTAGSFFKNPIVSEAKAHSLAERFPGVPLYPAGAGQMKVSLAWLLDRVLNLKGHKNGRARLFERQPLVIVTESGAHARDVDALANEVASQVRELTGLEIEREVETMG